MKITQLQDNISSYKNLFNDALPFKHLVIDNFLEEELAEQILIDFPPPKRMDIMGTDSKRLLGWQVSPKSPNYSFKPSLNALFDYLKQKELRDVFREIAGIKAQLLSDPDYYGSGLLLAPQGGIHKIHVDRTYHPNSSIFPRLVFLLYFNKDWRPEYGGGLQLWDKSIKKSKTIAPLFNRAILFEISSSSYHSIEDVTCPENVFRRGLNYFYLSQEAPPNSHMHDTMFFPRPDERINYWTTIATTNFPINLLGAIASRSSALRRIHSATRLLIKGNSTSLKRELPSEETNTRWAEFNNSTQ